MAQVSWNGSGDGAWGAGANWAGGVAPGAGDDVLVDGNAGGADLQVSGPGAADSVTVVDGVALSGSFGAGAVRVGTAGQAGTLDLVGAAVSAGVLVLQPGGTVTVDGGSTLEVGGSGAAAVGSLRIDAGAGMAGAGTISAVGGIEDDGAVDVVGGTLTVLGTVSGSGQVRIGDGATLALTGAGAPSTAGVAFAGANGTLEVATTTYFDGAGISSALTAQGVVAGFGAGDAIQYDGGTLTGAGFVDNGNGLGTLTLTDGGGVVGTLTLAGDYAGSTFQVVPDAAGTRIVVSAPPGGVGGGGVPSAGTAGPDVYSRAGGGDWNAAAGWTDVTTGAFPAVVAPGASNVVTVRGPAGSMQTVTGPGNAGSLTLLGGTALDGAFHAGTLAVGTEGTAGALGLRSGAVLTAGMAVVANGSVQVAGSGAVLQVAGPVQVGGFRTGGVAPNVLAAVAGGTVQAGGGLTLVAVPGVPDVVTVDGASSLELGTAGGAAAGQVTVDAGRVLVGAGVVSAVNGIANAGTIVATGGTLVLDGTVSGSGTLQIGAGAELALVGAGAPSAEAIGFDGAGGTLTVGGANGRAGLSAGGTIYGFAPGDVIHYAGATAAAAVSYQAGGNQTGTLTLRDGSGGVIGTLSLSGNYGGDVFGIGASQDGGADISCAVRGTPPAPVITSGGGLTNQAVQTVAGGGAEAGSTVTVLDGAAVLGSGVAAADGRWSVGVTLGGDGTHSLLAVDTDVAGNTGAASQAVPYVLDTTPPAVAITSRGGQVTSAPWQLTGTGEAGTTVAVRDGSAVLGTAAVGADGTWSAPVVLSGAGTHSLVAADTDAAGNTGTSAAVAFTMVPPSLDPLFDGAYYLARNPDVAAAGVDPFQHYVQFGWREGRDPSALFSTRYYLDQNPDVAAAGMNPLLHYETYGWKEGRDPSVLFSTNTYLAQDPDVAAAGMNPLLHFVMYGQAEGRATYAAAPHALGTPDPLVDAAYVYAHYPEVAAAGLDATAWFHTAGWQSGANPDAYFDTSYYLRQNPDVAAAGVDPLAHFEAYGWKEGRAPSLVFSDAKYLAANPDVAAAGVDPLAHYLGYGQAEGRAVFLPGGAGTPDPLVDAAFYDAQLGATLVPAGAAGQAQAADSYANGGWQRGLNPDAYFNTAYYLQQNPDVAAAGVDPLAHYETYGWHEGRNPSAGFSTGGYLAHNADVAAAGVDPLLHYAAFGQAEGRAVYAV